MNSGLTNRSTWLVGLARHSQVSFAVIPTVSGRSEGGCLGMVRR